MPALQEQRGSHDAPPPFRLDVQLHDLLKKSPAPRPILVPGRQPEKFPEPVFPQHQSLIGEAAENSGKPLIMVRAKQD